MKNNIVGWVEIPVSDMQRAIQFYQNVFDIQLNLQDMGELAMALFPADPKGRGAAGALVHHPDWYYPSEKGVLIYLSALSGDLSNELERVQSEGGKVLVPKRQISEEVGYMAVCKDSEGKSDCTAFLAISQIAYLSSASNKVLQLLIPFSEACT